MENEIAAIKKAIKIINNGPRGCFPRDIVIADFLRLNKESAFYGYFKKNYDKSFSQFKSLSEQAIIDKLNNYAIKGILKKNNGDFIVPISIDEVNQFILDYFLNTEEGKELINKKIKEMFNEVKEDNKALKILLEAYESIQKDDEEEIKDSDDASDEIEDNEEDDKALNFLLEISKSIKKDDDEEIEDSFASDENEDEEIDTEEVEKYKSPFFYYNLDNDDRNLVDCVLKEYEKDSPNKKFQRKDSDDCSRILEIGNQNYYSYIFLSNNQLKIKIRTNHDTVTYDLNEENLKSIKYEIDLYFNKRKYILFEDFVVYTNLAGYQILAKYKDAVSINANIDILRTNGSISSMPVNAYYSLSKNCYFILYDDFKYLKNKGLILCSILSYDTYVKEGLNPNLSNQLKMQSTLNKYGYNVGAKDNLSDEQRHFILDIVLYNNIYTYSELYSFIEWLIDRNYGNPNMENAIAKWQSDLDYLRNTDFKKPKINVKTIKYRKE